MPRLLFVHLLGLVLSLAAGATALSQEQDPAPLAVKAALAPLPPAPEGRILDQARVFAFDQEIHAELSAKLAEAFQRDRVDVYVAAYSFLLNETIEKRAERLLKEWVKQPRGLVIVYVRGGGQMTFAASDHMEEFIPRMDLEELFGVAAMSARQFTEPSHRLKAAVEQIVQLLSDKLQVKSEAQTLLRPDVLVLAVFAILAIFVIAVAGSAISRIENRPPERHHFPPARVFGRFGASNGGGTVGEVAFGRGTWGTRPPPRTS